MLAKFRQCEGSNVRTQGSFAFAAKGFQIIDVSLQYQGKPKLLDINGGLFSKASQNTDETTVCEIASRRISADRFHQDPRIPISVSKKIKQDWVANYFRGHRGDLLLVVTFQDEICGSS